MQIAKEMRQYLSSIGICSDMIAVAQNIELSLSTIASLL